MRIRRLNKRRSPFGNFSSHWAAGLLITVALLAVPGARAQSGSDQEAERTRAIELFKQGKLLDALPLFEKLAAQKPGDMVVHSRLGTCLVAKAATLTDDEERTKVRARARTVLVEAQKLGDTDDLTQVLISEIPPDGNVSAFSARKDVEDAMKDGEAAFAKGDYDHARAAYGRALILEPSEYEAALFTGDVYFRQKQMDEAADWFNRAIQINPDREIAYRYWGDALLLEDKPMDAREKYIQSLIAEPYNRASWMGIANWAKKEHVQISPPQIKSPHQISDRDGTPDITIDAKSITNNDGTLSWLAYEITCKAWRDELFAKEFSAEKTYRHSLPEEAAALRKVAQAVRGDMKAGKITSLDPSLAALIKLDDQGLLEAYILLSRADQGIAQDYAAYRQANRGKLHQYLEQYIAPAN